ncbi:MAG: T9SS type A sorting domain-containing protein [Bacteroidales bacterium]|jgi:hypothetical protein|nr:T9SS type A sorting domain-containing protein [Bacteroidales bacterium]
MKKILSFFVIMMALVVLVQAQNKMSRPTDRINVPVKTATINGNEATPDNAIPEFIRNANTTAIGSTYYDAVTNALSRNTIVNWQDGSVAAVWTMAQVSAQRGTGYNYNNGTTWGPQPNPATDRIETVRTGWGVIAPLNNGEIVAAHDGATGLTINKRATKGTGAWTESTLVGPGHDGEPSNTVLLWPTIATQGDTVHIFACTDNVEGTLYQGIQTPIVYYRSNDGGNTWSAPQLIAEMANENKEMADNYSLVAKNGKLVLLISEKFGETFYLESMDRGDTWVKHSVYPFAGGPNFDFTTGTFPMTALNDYSASVAIGDDGTVHIAFGTLMGARDEENAADEYSVWWAYDNIIYWNSTMPAFTVPFDTNTVETYAGRIGRPNIDGDDTVWFMDGYSQPEYRSNGPITFPQLVAEGGKVYMVYAALLEAPYYCGATSEYYHGIFATVSEDNGATWDDLNNVSWLSYHPEMYFVDWEQSELYGELMTISEGECFWPTMAHNSSNNKLNIMWYFDYIPGQAGGFASSPSSIYAINIDKDDVGEYKNTTEIYQNLWNAEGIKDNTLSELKLYPNPASNNVTIQLMSKESSNATLKVTNIMGQVVYTENVSVETGNNQHTINVSSFGAGFYLVNIYTTAGSTTQKLIVR